MTAGDAKKDGRARGLGGLGYILEIHAPESVMYLHKGPVAALISRGKDFSASPLRKTENVRIRASAETGW